MLRRFIFRGLLSVATLLVVACAGSAKITFSNTSPGARDKQLDGVLVVGVARSNPARIDFEDAFTRGLARNGIRAMASHSLVAGDDVTSEQALAVAAEHKLEMIMLTRYVGESQVEVYHPGTRYYDVVPTYGPRMGGWHGYYGHAVEVAYDPAVYSTNRTVTLISDLYEVSTQKVMWTAASDAIKAGNEKELQAAFVSAFIRDLKDQGLL